MFTYQVLGEEILYINSLRLCVRLSDLTILHLIHRQNRPTFSMAEPVLLSNCDHWTQRKVTDAEKSDGGRREKWREKEKWRWMQRKDKTTVGWRAFEVLKPRSWESGPETSRWGRETQVLRAMSWNLTLRSWNPGHENQISRSWNPGPESVRALLIGWSN